MCCGMSAQRGGERCRAQGLASVQAGQGWSKQALLPATQRSHRIQSRALTPMCVSRLPSARGMECSGGGGAGAGGSGSSRQATAVVAARAAAAAGATEAAADGAPAGMSRAMAATYFSCMAMYAARVLIAGSVTTMYSAERGQLSGSVALLAAAAAVAVVARLRRREQAVHGR